MIAGLKDKILNLSDDISLLIAKSSDLSSLDDIRVNALGKKGSITSHLKDLREYDDISKREIGSLVNQIKNKNVGIINFKGYWDPLINLINHIINEEFMGINNLNCFEEIKNLKTLKIFLKNI